MRQVTPRSLLEYNVAQRTFITLKVTPVPNYEAGLYRTRRMQVTARDGATIPLTLLWRPDAMPDGEGRSAPCHLYGYGSCAPRAHAPRTPDTDTVTVGCSTVVIVARS